MADTQSTVKLCSADVTDVGMVRDHNEDTAYVDPELRFFIVADGMGGHAAGEVASAMAVEHVRIALLDKLGELQAFALEPSDESRREVVAVLENAVRAAHQAVFSRGVKESDKQGMGTTLDVLLITGAEAFVAHVGDSRTYLMRDGKADQITTDHTVAEVLVIEGKLSAEEAQSSPLRTILVNAIGVSADVGVEISHVRLRQGDRILLCSDGLHDYFPSDDEIAEHLLDGELQEGLSEMVELAKQRGGHDNITGIAVEVLDCPAPTSDDTEMLNEGASQAEAEAVPHPVSDGGTRPLGERAKDSDDDSDDGADDEPAPQQDSTTSGRPSTLPLGVDTTTAQPVRETAPMDVVADPPPTDSPDSTLDTTAEPNGDIVDVDDSARESGD